MKEHKSHMSMVARFAYIFATIVTVFAQMGAAAPALIASAQTDPMTVKVSSSSDSTGATAKPGDTITITMTGEAPSNVRHLGFDIKGSGLTYLNAVSNDDDSSHYMINNSEYVADDSKQFDIKTNDYLWQPDDSNWTITYKVNASGLPAGGITITPYIRALSKDTYTPITIKPAAVSASSSSSSSSSSSTSSSSSSSKPTTTTTTPDTSTMDGSGLSLGFLSDKGPFKLGSDVSLYLHANLDSYPTKYRDVQIGIEGDALGDNLVFDPDAMTSVMKAQGFTAKTPVNQEDHTVYEYDSSNDYFRIWAFSDHSLRIEWSKGVTGDRIALLTLKANRPTSTTGVKLTPHYLGSMTAGDTPHDLGAGSPATIVISQPSGFEGSQYKLDAHSITGDDPNNGSIIHMNLFPLFYIQDPDDSSLYSFIQNYNAGTQFISGSSGLTAITQYRKSVINNVPFPNSSDPTDAASVSAGWGGSSVTGANFGGTFEDFAKIKSDGQQDSTTVTGFKTGKTYKLKPVRPYGGADSNRFYRIKTDTLFSQHYYMPDGLPTLSFDANGKMSPDMTNADGNAKKGQWHVSSDGKTLEASLYKIKYVQVVDDDTGDPIDGVTVKLKNQTSGGMGMVAKTTTSKYKNLKSVETTFKGTGELDPTDYVADASGQGGPFYLPEGTQELDSISGLPSGYSADNVKFDMSVDNSTDVIKLANQQNATLSDDGQTIILAVHKDVPKNYEVNIQKVAQSDSKPLSGATFDVTEVGDNTIDKWTTPAGTTLTSGDDGMVPGIKVASPSKTQTRTFFIKENDAPKGYKVGNTAGYYATWVKGTGFTKVGTAQDNQSTASDDGFASVNTDGTLVIEDPTKDSLYPGGKQSDLKIEYVNAAEEAISGAQLPVLDPNKKYGTDDALGMKGVGGIVYNPGLTDFTGLTKADSGLVAGTTLANDSIMYTSKQKSDVNGQGIVQGLWSQLGIDPEWKSLDASSAAYLLSSAMDSGKIPTNPEMDYSLINDDQRARAEATNASDYYSLGGTIVIGEDADGTITATQAKGSNKYNSSARDNKVVPDQTNKAAKVYLFKVKHVSVVDVNGSPISGATVRFTNLVTAQPTNDKGEAELVPADTKGTPTTSFVWPDGTQKFVSAKDAKGNDLDLGSNPTSFGTWFSNAQSDELALASSGSGISISDGKTDTNHAAGQYIELKTTTAQTKTTIKIHKQDRLDPTKPVKNVSFTVWPSNGTEAGSTAVTTDPTNASGDTSASFDIASTTGQYYIKENDIPDGVMYQQDKDQHLFTAGVSGSVTAVSADDKAISVGDNGVLNFSDMPSAGGGGLGVGDNGTNGGTLSIKKIALGDSTQTAVAGATFTLRESAGISGYNDVPMTTANGISTANLGNPTDSDRIFTIQEATAPGGYVKNGNTYRLKIDKNGNMTLGDYANPDPTENQTPDSVITLGGDTAHQLVYRDAKANPTITIHKQDFGDASKALQGAVFSITPLEDTSATATGTTDANGDVTISVAKLSPSNTYTLTETAAPDTYTKDSTPYTVSLDAQGNLSGVSGGANASATDSAHPGVVVFKDVKGGGVGDNGTNGGVLTIDKVDKTTGKSLPGATFTVTESDLSGGKIVSSNATTSSSAKATFNLGAAIPDHERIFTISEKTNPSGYTLNSTPYQLLIKANGAMYLGASGADDTAMTADHTADNTITFASATDHTLKFADTVAQSQTIKVKKVDSNGNPLQGANFAIQELTASGGATGSATAMKSIPSLTSDANGMLQFDSPATDNNIHYYRLTENTAPNGYDKGADSMIAYQYGKGIVGVKLPSSTSQTGNTAGPLTKVSSSLVTYTDQLAKAISYPIHVRRQNILAKQVTSVNQPFTVTLQKIGDPSAKLPIDVDQATGNATVDTDSIAKLLGKTITPTTGSDNLQLSVSSSKTSYTLPVSRIVTFNWGEGGGFKIPSTNKDGMVVAVDPTEATYVSANKVDKMQDGGLRINLRRDTLVSQSTAAGVDQTTLSLVPNVRYQLAYSYNGQALGTQTISTGSTGVAVIQAPTTSETFTGTLPLNANVNVTLTQLSTANGYQPFTKSATLMYNSAKGYTGLNTVDNTPLSGYSVGVATAQFDPDTGKEDDAVIAGLAYTDQANSNVSAAYYFFGGTQIIVPQTPSPNSVTLNQAPQVMNFGHAQVLSGEQSLNLLPSEDTTDAQANFNTSLLGGDAVADGTTTTNSATTDTSGKASYFLNAQVTQTGSYAGGWRLKMAMSTLTSEDGDTIPNSSVTMGKPTVYLTADGKPDANSVDLNNGYAETVQMTGSAPAENVTPDLKDNTDAQTLVNTGATGASSAGVYSIAWNVDSVKMNLPAMLGQMNANYHSAVSWDLVTAP